MNNNLKPFEKGSNRAIENGKKGGLASAEVRKEKKVFKEVVKELLNQDIAEGEKAELKEIYPYLDIENVSMRTLIINKQIRKAIEGDTKACEFILNLSGEKPTKDENNSLFSFDWV